MLVHEVLAPTWVWQHQAVAADDPSTSDATVLVGRNDELSTLRDALGAARAGRPTAVLLTGEPGIGKTRLADEAAIVARADGMRVLRGEADASRRDPMEL